MPKIFIAHGVKDSTMPIDVSGRKNVAQLKKEGYDVTYHEHEGGHGTPREIVRESIEWFLGKDRRHRTRMPKRLSRPVVAAADAAGIMGIRAGAKSDHRFVGVWPIVVDGAPVRAIVDADVAAAGTRRSSRIRSE